MERRIDSEEDNVIEAVKEGKYRYEESIYEGYPSYFMEGKKEIFLHYDEITK